jgi:D-alanine transaminase
MMEGVTEGAEEILLFNERDELTEASTSNVFIVRDGSITTPNLDHQKLAGITRNMLVDMLRDHSTLSVIEGSVSRADLSSADEVWLTSSTKEISPVVQIDGELVGAGRPGPVWSEAQTLFDRYRFDY